MRKINKLSCPQEFSEYIRKENPKIWDDFSRSKQHGSVYGVCMGQLLHEQNGLSGYTEKPISDSTKGLHIDHFRRRGIFRTPQNCFDWNNLIADEHNPNYGADYKDKNISQKDEYNKLIDPVTEDPHKYFTYQTNGNIVAKADLEKKDKEKAEFTITKFNLQHPALVEMRGTLIKYVNEYKDTGLSDNDIFECLQNHGFTSVVEYVLNNIKIETTA